MRMSDWSSDVCSSDLLLAALALALRLDDAEAGGGEVGQHEDESRIGRVKQQILAREGVQRAGRQQQQHEHHGHEAELSRQAAPERKEAEQQQHRHQQLPKHRKRRSEEHTSELQSQMRISYDAFRLTKTQNT